MPSPLLRPTDIVGRRAPTAVTLSVGMPAFNAEKTIESAIDCLLQQTYTDYELIVSDNASTDSTWSIIDRYARRDPRVIGIRQRLNIGANGNYSAVVDAARGRYFKWASSNDWCAPTFLERCITYLESRPDVVLVAPRTRLFKEDPGDATDYDGDIVFDDPTALMRFIKVSQSLKLNNVLNGVARTDVLRRTRLIEHYPGADVVLVGHLALLGKITLVDDYLFYRRMDRATATRLMDPGAVHRHHYPSSTLRSLFPAWRRAAGWARAATNAGLSMGDTARALAWVARMTYWSSADFRRDIVEASRHLSRGH